MSETIHYLDILALFISAIFTLCLSVFVYFQNRKSLINRVFAFMGILLSLNPAGALIKHLINSPDWVIFSNRFTNAAGSLVVCSIFYFCIVFPEGKDLSKPLKIALYLPAVFFSIMSFTPNLMIQGLQPTNTKYLYMAKLVMGPLRFYYNIYTFIYCFVGAIPLIIYKLVKSSGVQRKKLAFFVLAVVMGIVTVQVFTQFLPHLGIVQLDSLGRSPLIISAALVAYSIIRFKLFTITPQVAAEEILSTLERSILVSDPRGNILFQGKIQHPPDEEKLQKIVNVTLDEGDLTRYTTIIDHTPFNVSTSVFPGGGVVMLFDDLTQIEEEEAREKIAHDQLAKMLTKDRALGKLLLEITTDMKIDESLKSLRTLLAKDPDAMQAIEYISNLRLKRAQMLVDVKRDKEALEKNFSRIKDINKRLVERELRMVELKELIEKLKAA